MNGVYTHMRTHTPFIIYYVCSASIGQSMSLDQAKSHLGGVYSPPAGSTQVTGWGVMLVLFKGEVAQLATAVKVVVFGYHKALL